MSKDSTGRRPKSMVLDDTPKDFVVVQKRGTRLSMDEIKLKVDAPVRKSQSFGEEKMHKKPHTPHKPTVNVIEENNELVIERSDTMGSGRFERNGSVQTIGTSNPYRKTSRGQRSVSNAGIANNGYTVSGSSSIYGGSVNSLPVMREQYCSCTRWSKLEKLLLLIISILVLVIIGLIVGLGVMVDSKDRKTHWWTF